MSRASDAVVRDLVAGSMEWPRDRSLVEEMLTTSGSATTKPPILSLLEDVPGQPDEGLVEHVADLTQDEDWLVSRRAVALMQAWGRDAAKQTRN